MYINLQGGPAVMPPSHGGGEQYQGGYEGGNQNQGSGYQGGQNQGGYPGGQQNGGNQQNNQNDELEQLAQKLLPKILRKLDGCCAVM